MANGVKVRCELRFKHAPMSAGKSLELLQMRHNYSEMGVKVWLYTAKVDTRYGEGSVTSRIGLTAPANCFHEEMSFITDFESVKHEERPRVILVDEAQFLSKKLVVELRELVDKYKLRIVCFGLRADFRRELFEGSAALLALADKLEEVEAMCGCGANAVFNMRVNSEGKKVVDGPTVEIGGNDRYRSVCSSCYYKA